MSPVTTTKKHKKNVLKQKKHKAKNIFYIPMATGSQPLGALASGCNFDCI